MKLPTRNKCFAAARRHRIGPLAMALAGQLTAAHAEDASWRLIDSCQNQDFSALACWSTAQPLGASTHVLIRPTLDLTLQTRPLATVNFANQGEPLFSIASLDVTGYSFDPRPEFAMYNVVLNVARGTLNVTGDTAVGALGTGTINQSGGDFQTGSLTFGPGFDPRMGFAGLSSFNLSGGSLTVAGKVSLGDDNPDGQFRQSAGSLNVGSVWGPGSFIHDGGTFVLGTSISVGSFVMGRVSLLAPATFTLSGSQRSLKADALTVGESFEGLLKVDGQAQMSTGSAALGSSHTTVGFINATGNGRIEVTGSGSSWTNTKDLILGGTAMEGVGSGTLAISDNGQVATGGKLQIWSKGTVTVNQGTLSVGSLGGVAGGLITFNGGKMTVNGAEGLGEFQGSFVWTAGTLMVPSTGFAVGVGTPIGTSLRLDRGKQLILGGSLNIVSHDAEVTFAGGSLVAPGGVNNLGRLTIQGNMPQTLVTGRLLALAGSTTTFVQGLSTALVGPVYLQPGAVVTVNGDAQAFFLGPVVEMTGSQFLGPGLARFEGGLTIEAEQGLFGAPHSLGSALHDGPVAFGDLNVDTVDVGANGAADLLTVNGPLSFAGTLRLSAFNGYAAKPGDHFQLFNFTGSSGHFTTIDASGLALSPDLALDTSRLYIDGTISVQAVPEPAQWLLMLCGLAGLQAVKRRHAA